MALKNARSYTWSLWVSTSHGTLQWSFFLEKKQDSSWSIQELAWLAAINWKQWSTSYCDSKKRTAGLYIYIYI